MRYSFPEVHRIGGHVLRRAIAAGTLSRNQMFISVPDDFDWAGHEPKPISAIPIARQVRVKPAILPKPASAMGQICRKLLGDRVHDFLQPFVRRIDRKWGTKLSGCRACSRRRQKLNRLHLWLLSFCHRSASFLQRRCAHLAARLRRP